MFILSLQRMEDNPGEVTAEAEEHYEQLAKEVSPALTTHMMTLFLHFFHCRLRLCVVSWKCPVWT